MKQFDTHCVALVITLILFAAVSSCASNAGSSDNTAQNEQNELTLLLPAPEPSIDLFIAQIENHNSPTGAAEILTYLSVIDEEGHLIEKLDLSNFQITHNDNVIERKEIYFSAENGRITTPVSVSIIMDYSTSITDFSETRVTMEEAVAGFVDLMHTDDQAEIIKFNTGIKYLLPFCADKSLLKIGIAFSEDLDGGHTYLYDTLFTGIEDTATQPGRKAVIALTDGIERHEDSYPGDGRRKEDVIALAKARDVPLFIIGLGSGINRRELQEISEETSGHFYQAVTSDELKAIYIHISKLLSEGQYLLVFEAPPNEKSDNTLAFSVTYNGLVDRVEGNFPFAINP